MKRLKFICNYAQPILTEAGAADKYLSCQTFSSPEFYNMYLFGSSSLSDIPFHLPLIMPLSVLAPQANGFWVLSLGSPSQCFILSTSVHRSNESSYENDFEIHTLLDSTITFHCPTLLKLFWLFEQTKGKNEVFRKIEGVK